ncbi:hypothetical protein GCM10027062_15170 [Nocardioides hungaricus]
MRRTARRTASALLAGTAAAALAAALMAPAGSASAEPSAGPSTGTPPAGSASGSPTAPDTRELDREVKLGGAEVSLSPRQRRLLRAPAQAPAVGDVKLWPYLQYTTGTFDFQDYELRGIGENIQVWVATDTSFPAGDCRNTLGLAEITDAQVASFVKEFDSNIYPKESRDFSVPPALQGENALAPQFVEGMPADYYAGTADEAGDTIVLVDNVKDENYSAPGTPDGQTYVAGFFTSTFNQLTDRNVMTVDAFDWAHRTGANPPDDSADPAFQQCAADLGLKRPLGESNPRLYEGTFAHEYQHLLESYEDEDETSWVNEGLADYAQTLVGYVDTRTPPKDPAADSHLACFSGYGGESFGGPENSLTMWEDQGGPEVLCDYGATYSLMMYLRSKYGAKFLADLHREDRNGLSGLNAVLKRYKSKRNAMQTVRDWAAMAALDSALDRSKRLTGGDRAAFTSNWLSSNINWSTPQAYESAGAPPNGSDYVRLRSGKKWLRASQLRSLRFQGAATLAPDPVEWTIDATPPDTVPAGDATCGGELTAGTGAAALYSGCGTDLDRSVVREVSVPDAGGTLSFDALYDIESLWDYAFVQVSTDGGTTWTSLATEDTTTEADPQANPLAVANLPGLTGASQSWTTQTADLSAYAGKDVLLAFRYITDSAVDEAGLWVRNVSVAGTPLATDTLDGWKSITQVNPVEVPGWTVQLVGIARNGESWIERLKIDRSFTGKLGKRQLRRALGTRAGIVSALVMVDDPSESLRKYGRYTLRVNGKLQPGG